MFLELMDACIQLLHTLKEVWANLGKQIEILVWKTSRDERENTHFVSLPSFAGQHWGCYILTTSSSKEDNKLPGTARVLSHRATAQYVQNHLLAMAKVTKSRDTET